MLANSQRNLSTVITMGMRAANDPSEPDSKDKGQNPEATLPLGKLKAARLNVI